MKLSDLFDAPAVALNYTEAASNKIPYLGAGLFPAKKKMGLDLKRIKTRKGLSVSLSPCNFDAKSTIRSRDGLKLEKPETAFFRESMRVKEEDEMAIDLITAGISMNYAPETTAGAMPTTGFKKISGIKSIPEMNPSPDTLETTTLDETEYKTYIPGLAKALCFPGEPTPLGMPGAEVSAVLETTAYITPIGAPVWVEKPTDTATASVLSSEPVATKNKPVEG